MTEQTPNPDDRHGQHRHRARLVTTVVAVVLGVLGVVALAVGVGRQQPAPPAPNAAPAPPATSSPDPDGRGTASASPRARPQQPTPDAAPLLGYSEPQRLQIPRIEVDSELVDLGLDPEGVMETPVPVEAAGWFTPSPPPGVGGATVLAGHVTWDQRPTVFFRLGELADGDEVTVTRDDGTTVAYEVYRTGTFPKDSFPSEEVYSRPDTSELRLITCGGEYDSTTNRYLDNVIVWARAVDVQRA